MLHKTFDVFTSSITSNTGSTVTTLSKPPTFGETADFKSTYAGGKYASTDKKFVATVKVAKQGAAAIKPKTVGEIFAEAVKKCGNQPVRFSCSIRTL